MSDSFGSWAHYVATMEPWTEYLGKVEEALGRQITDVVTIDSIYALWLGDVPVETAVRRAQDIASAAGRVRIALRTVIDNHNREAVMRRDPTPAPELRFMPTAPRVLLAPTKVNRRPLWLMIATGVLIAAVIVVAIFDAL